MPRRTAFRALNLILIKRKPYGNHRLTLIEFTLAVHLLSSIRCQTIGSDPIQSKPQITSASIQPTHGRAVLR